MFKSQLRKATTEQVIGELMVNYTNYIISKQLRKSSRRYENHCKNLSNELIKRNLMTDDLIKYLMED